MKARLDLAQIKRANPLPWLAEQAGLLLRKSGQGFITNCPFHEDRTPSFHIFPTDEGWGFKCYAASCGKRGDAISFIGYTQFGEAWTGRGRQFKAVLRQLRSGYMPATLSEMPYQAPIERPTITPDVQYAWELALRACALELQDNAPVLAYLERRCIHPDSLAHWRFGFWPHDPPGGRAPVLTRLYAAGLTEEELLAARLLRRQEHGSYAFFGGGRDQSGRIMCADLDAEGRPHYLLGRVLPWEDQGRSARYLGLADFAKPVLGLASLPEDKTPVFLVEGAWNMVILQQWGYAAVAVSGAELSQTQEVILRAIERPLVPVQDMDPPDAHGVCAGKQAVAHWRKALPGLHAPLRLPQRLGSAAIKDVNDLAMQADGQTVFAELVVSLIES